MSAVAAWGGRMQALRVRYELCCVNHYVLPGLRQRVDVL
jgi:hypothetical protein